MNIKVNPYKGYANSPYVVIKVVNQRFFDLIYQYPYTRKEGCYFYQDEHSGHTDFFFHGGDWIPQVKPFDVPESLHHVYGPQLQHYTTPNSGGFGGRTFGIYVKIKDHLEQDRVVRVDVNGPWSGGCYCANKYLTKYATEVTYCHYKQWMPYPSHISGFLTLEKVNGLLANTPWIVKTSNRFQTPGEIWPELMYAEPEDRNGPKESWNFKSKDQLKPETIELLDNEWQEPWPDGTVGPTGSSMQFRAQN